MVGAAVGEVGFLAAGWADVVFAGSSVIVAEGVTRMITSAVVVSEEVAVIECSETVGLMVGRMAVAGTAAIGVAATA